MLNISFTLILVLCFERFPVGASLAALGAFVGCRNRNNSHRSDRAQISTSKTRPSSNVSFRRMNLFADAQGEPTCSDSFVFTDRFVSKSGLPVCKYALGGAARSSQPTSLVHDYCETIQTWFTSNGNDTMTATTTRMAPFLFYYNPHRYADFMKGIRQVSEGRNSKFAREDLFLVSGGTDRSKSGMEKRLLDALEYSGKEYLDMFVLEYLCSYEDEDEILDAISIAKSWIESGKVRYVAASTHSHRVGAWLGSLTDKNESPLLDAMMLRYNMAHRSAAERISFPACSKADIPVLAFTTTRWNRLQDGHPDADASMRTPTTPQCLSFALASRTTPWPVEIALHSARDSNELEEAMACLSRNSAITQKEDKDWREYGDLKWNDIDGFDEYPEEQTQ